MLRQLALGPLTSLTQMVTTVARNGLIWKGNNVLICRTKSPLTFVADPPVHLLQSDAIREPLRLVTA